MLREKGTQRIYEIIFLALASISILCVLVICVFLFSQGIPAIFEIGFFDFIFGTEWAPTATDPSFGILPMIVGSLYITLGAVILGVPIGILTAVFMTKYCPPKIYRTFKTLIELMAGIPSIIYGFFGMVVLVPLVRDASKPLFDFVFQVTGDPNVALNFHSNGQSILTASLLLGFMILPTVINLSESALKAVPDYYYEGARALGATHERAIFRVMLPAAKSGVLASVVLGIGRAIGETMAVIMVAGSQPRLTANILQGIRTMTANVVMEMKYAEGLHEDALIATGVVLFVFILIINLGFSLINRKAGN